MGWSRFIVLGLLVLCLGARAAEEIEQVVSAKTGEPALILGAAATGSVVDGSMLPGAGVEVAVRPVADLPIYAGLELSGTFFTAYGQFCSWTPLYATSFYRYEWSPFFHVTVGASVGPYLELGYGTVWKVGAFGRLGAEFAVTDNVELIVESRYGWVGGIPRFAPQAGLRFLL